MNSPGSSPDALDLSDMASLAAGHDPALNSLIQRHSEKLFHYLLRQLNDEADAADLAQETFVRVYQNSRKFDPANKFSTWLYTIATNLVRNRFRWRYRHPEVSLDANPADEESWKSAIPSHSPSPAEILQSEERAEEVRRAVQNLPEKLRTPLLLAEYQELSTAEIAAIVKRSPKAVESLLYRARLHLRASLQKQFAGR